MTRPRYSSHMERLATNLALTETGCLEWQGYVSRDGYCRMLIGSRTDGSRRSALVHRVVWEAVNEPIPTGLVVDHLCRNRACARPDHLELVSQYENVMRGERATQDRCKYGHLFDEKNTYRRGNRRGCRECNYIAVRRYQARRAAA